MKKIINSNFLIVFISILTLITDAYAQKLPNTQKDSQWLLKSAIIDGKITEWANGLKAYNKATRIEYLLANNTESIYLAIKSKDVGTTAKIMSGGITFNINPLGKKIATGSSITFPLTNSGYRKLSSGAIIANFSILKDSLLIKNAIGRLKEIKVLNFKGVTDTVLSIYNEYDIKTSINYSGKELTLELIMPRKLIGLGDNSNLFAYQIILNGVIAPPVGNGGLPPPSTPAPGRAPSSDAYIGAEIRSATDFWGSYTLAKEP